MAVSGSIAFLIAAAAPLWFRVGTPSGSEPGFLGFFVRHRSYPYYTHAVLGRNGLEPGPIPHGGAANRIPPQAYTPWIDIAPLVQTGKVAAVECVNAAMIHGWQDPLTNAAFVIEFSTDRTNVCKRVLRKGRGNEMSFVMDEQTDGSWKIVQDAEQSRRTREAVEAFPPCPGRPPKLFPVTTGVRIDSERANPAAVADERVIVNALGVNGVAGPFDGYPYRHASVFGLGPALHPDRQAVERRAKSMLKRIAENDALRRELVFVNVGDETEVLLSHATNCAVCAAAVPGGATADKTDGERYYLTSRRLADAVTEGLRTLTEAIQDACPGVPVGLNNGIDLVFSGNLARSHVDWFRVYGSGALTYGWGEDWANFGRTRQINSIYWDAMRAACEPRQTPFGFYNILAHCCWDVKAKAYAAIGRGARSIHYFNYGPCYAVTSDAQSMRPDVLKALRDVNYSIGPVEREILSARCARGDAAILLGMAGDIWMDGEDSEYGMERTAMSLLLRHCNVRTDVLGEDQVAERLRGYPLLFVLDRNVRKDVAAAILAWVEKGGRLYLGPNAMTADEANRPLDLGFVRPAYAKVEKAGRPRFELVKRRELDRYEGMRVIVGSAKPYFDEMGRGNGRVLLSGMFPGLDYWGSATANTNRFNMLKYPSAHRVFLKKRVLGGILPRCETSDPCVEASLLEGPSADVLVFSNWTGAPTEVEYVVRRPDGTVRTRGARKIDAGGFVVLEK